MTENNSENAWWWKSVFIEIPATSEKWSVDPNVNTFYWHKEMFPKWEIEQWTVKSHVDALLRLIERDLKDWELDELEAYFNENQVPDNILSSLTERVDEIRTYAEWKKQATITEIKKSIEIERLEEPTILSQGLKTSVFQLDNDIEWGSCYITIREWLHRRQLAYQVDGKGYSIHIPPEKFVIVSHDPKTWNPRIQWWSMGIGKEDDSESWFWIDIMDSKEFKLLKVWWGYDLVAGKWKNVKPLSHNGFEDKVDNDVDPIKLEKVEVTAEVFNFALESNFVNDPTVSWEQMMAYSDLMIEEFPNDPRGWFMRWQAIMSVISDPFFIWADQDNGTYFVSWDKEYIEQWKYAFTLFEDKIWSNLSWFDASQIVYFYLKHLPWEAESKANQLLAKLNDIWENVSWVPEYLAYLEKAWIKI